MAIDDHKTRYRPESKDDASEDLASVLSQMAQMQQDTIRLMAEMRSSGSGANADVIEKLIAQQERLITKTIPENAVHPGISAYSYPEGDLAKPKPPLKCKMLWVGFEETVETLTPLEVDLLNRMEPGVYRVRKTNGVEIKLTVAAKRNDRDDLEELSFMFPCKGDARHDHGSKVSYLQQALGDRIPNADELLVELAKLKAELATAGSH